MLISRAFRLAKRRLCALGRALGVWLWPARPGPSRGGEGRWFFDPGDRQWLAREFRRSYPDVTDAVIAAADRACRHRFDLLGSGEQDLRDPVDWHVDPVARRRWPQLPTPLLPIQFRSDRSDIKRVWELSRCQHFGVLGQAYLLTGDERYPEEWVAQMLDWDRQNPPMTGPNWMVPMEAAIRIVNWVWARAFMADAPAFDPRARRVFDRNLLQHGRMILGQLEQYGNHRFSNFIGLLVLGLAAPASPEAEEWRDVGLRGLSEELQKQVRPDGTHFEGSVPYHRLVLEMAATAWLLLRRNGMDLPDAAADAVKRMFRFTAAYVPPTGLAPQVGDADDGRLQELTPLDKRDHGYLLSLAAVLTGEADYKRALSPHAEAFWLLGSDGLTAYDALPTIPATTESTALADSGFYVLRTERVHAFVCCRRPHPDDIGAHVHNDHLSFTLSVDGVDFIVDAGTGTYTGDVKERNRFRSVMAHNTPHLDGHETNALSRIDPFRLRDTADCRVLEWRIGAAEDTLVAEHNGYAPLQVTVRRRFTLDRLTHRLTVADLLAGKGRHRVGWRFLFAPEVRLRAAGEAVVASRDGVELLIRLAGPAGLALRPGQGAYSPRYGVRQTAPVLNATLEADLPLETTFILEARRG